jgi:hypothetical protein
MNSSTLLDCPPPSYELKDKTIETDSTRAFFGTLEFENLFKEAAELRVPGKSEIKFVNNGVALYNSLLNLSTII